MSRVFGTREAVLGAGLISVHFEVMNQICGGNYLLMKPGGDCHSMVGGVRTAIGLLYDGAFVVENGSGYEAVCGRCGARFNLEKIEKGDCFRGPLGLRESLVCGVLGCPKTRCYWYWEVANRRDLNFADWIPNGVMEGGRPRT